MSQVIIQSFAPHGLKFLEPMGSAHGIPGDLILEIPAGFVPNNYVITDSKIVEHLSSDPSFKSLVDTRTIRMLDTLPSKYDDPSKAVTQLRGNLIDTTEKLTAEQEKTSKLEAEMAVLKAELELAKNGGKV